MQIVTELKTRGISDIFIACVDGLKGLPETIEAVFPQTQFGGVIFSISRTRGFSAGHEVKVVRSCCEENYRRVTVNA